MPFAIIILVNLIGVDSMKPFVGSLIVFKNDGVNYTAFTPKKDGTVSKYNSETNKTTLVNPKHQI